MKIDAICILSGLLLVGGTPSSRAASLPTSGSHQGCHLASVDAYSTPVDEVDAGLIGDLQDELSVDKAKNKKKKKKKKGRAS